MFLNNFLRISGVFLFFVLFNLQVRSVTQNDTIKSFQTSVNVKSKITNLEIKDLVLTQLIKLSGDHLSLKDINSIKYMGIYNLKGLGKSQIYKIKLSYSLPTVYHYSLALIIDNHCHGFLIALDIVELIKIKAISNEYYFGSRYINRYGYGYFKVFEFNNNYMYQVFESNEAVSNFSYGCTSFENGNLKLQNIDVNKDGYLDLKFTGIKDFYCNGLEQYGREDRKPLRKKRIILIFYYNPKNATWTQG